MAPVENLRSGRRVAQWRPKVACDRLGATEAVCHQTVSLIARGLEAAGIPAALVSVMPPLSSAARPPRQLIRWLNIGATGRPGDVEGQLETLRRMVALIGNTDGFGAVDKDAKPEN